MTSLSTAKRLAFYAVIAVLSSSAIAPKAHALPQIDPDFNLLELRHREQDIREGLARPEGEPAEATAYDAAASNEPTAASGYSVEEGDTQAPLSLVERRRQAAAQRNK